MFKNFSNFLVKWKELKNLLEAVHRERNYQCEECDFPAVKREELKSNVEAVQRMEIINVTREELKNHVEAVHRDGDYQCDKCDFAAVMREELKSHVKVVHWDVYFFSVQAVLFLHDQWILCQSLLNQVTNFLPSRSTYRCLEPSLWSCRRYRRFCVSVKELSSTKSCISSFTPRSGCSEASVPMSRVLINHVAVFSYLYHSGR